MYFFQEGYNIQSFLFKKNTAYFISHKESEYVFVSGSYFNSQHKNR